MQRGPEISGSSLTWSMPSELGFHRATAQANISTAPSPSTPNKHSSPRYALAFMPYGPSIGLPTKICYVKTQSEGKICKIATAQDKETRAMETASVSTEPVALDQLEVVSLTIIA